MPNFNTLWEDWEIHKNAEFKCSVCEVQSTDTESGLIGMPIYEPVDTYDEQFIAHCKENKLINLCEDCFNETRAKFLPPAAV